MSSLSTSTNRGFNQTTWDFAIIGAGPAGAIAAYQLARHSRKVLLLDKSQFPRYKVCGCCINNSAQTALLEVGLQSILADSKAVPLNRFLLSDGCEKASVKVHNSVSISRSRFDQRLLEAAIDVGVTFRERASAQVLRMSEDYCTLKVHDSLQDREFEIETKIALVADGLNGHALDLHQEFKAEVESASHIGAGIVLSDEDKSYEAGTIYMACGEGGYVGLVRLEDGRLDIAAALAPTFVQRTGSPGAAAQQLLEGNQMSVPQGLASGQWTGTQKLSRRRLQVGGQRLLVIGDASGYPEPFTGEGIGWALWSGILSARLVINGIENWQPKIVEEWKNLHLQFQKQQTRSSMIGRVLRNKVLRHGLVTALARSPLLATSIVELATHSNLSRMAQRSLR
ncbi:MAG TPA: FAD-dependent monooxygenase [Oculatellaceae cyanobacterium]